MSRWSLRLRALGAHSLDVPAGCAVDQHAIIRARVLALAPVVAALTLAWTVLDLLVLPRDAWPIAIADRVVIAAGLYALATRGKRLRPLAVLRLFLWLQALGFGVLQAMVLSGTAIDATSIGYGLAPFVIAAQIALFPVTWLQALRLGTAPAAALALPIVGAAGPVDARLWSDVWLLALLLGMAAWTCQAQLQLLIGLSAARLDASRDALTGLANRRAALERLQAEHDRLARHPGALSVLMLDLDRFKQVNDRWGHAAGDRVLQAVAGAITAELRGADLGARFGGEEFLVMLPDTVLDDAMQAAERIRRHIASLSVDIGDAAPLSVTVSIGAARLQAGELIEDCLARADAALYRAKAEGRDRCIAAAPVGVPATA